MTRRADALVDVAMLARSARASVKDVVGALEQASTLAGQDAELRRLTAAALNAADMLLLAIGDIRHELASRAMTAGYRK